MERTGVIIVAGGSGHRAGGARPKQFQFLGGMPVLARTINNFAAAMPGAEIVAVLPEQHIEFWNNLAARFDVAAHRVVAGGAERFDSVKNGLAALTTDPELIAVQDGVRPLGTAAMIRRVAEAAARHGAAVPVVEAVDSFRETEGEPDAEGIVPSRIVDRRRLRIVQTPQFFRADVLRAVTALPQSTLEKAESLEQLRWLENGYKIGVGISEVETIGIDTPEDLERAEAFLLKNRK